MFGTIGGPELLLILVIALIVFGPRQLPEIGKSVGRMLVEFRRAGNDFKRTLEDEVETERLSAAPRRLETPPAVEAAPASPPGTVAASAAADAPAGAQAEPAEPAPADAPTAERAPANETK